MAGEFEAKKSLLAILDNMPFMAWYKDAAGRFVAVNRPFAAAVGKPKEEIIGRTSFDVWPPERARRFVAADSEVLRTRAAKTGEEQSGDGGGRWFETVITPVFDDSGEIAGTIGMAKDITAQKKAERLLSEQSDYARLLLQTIPSAVYTVDNDQRITSWNAMAEKITGYTAGEVLGKNVAHFAFHPCRDDCALFADPVIPCQNATCKIKTKAGEVRYLLKNVDVLRNDNGELIGRIECFDDVTEKLLVEEQLKESELRLSLAISGTGIGMWDWHVPSGEIIHNDEWAASIGYTLEELRPVTLGTWKNLTHAGDLKKALALIGKCFAGEADRYECELRLKHKSGRWVWVLDRGKVVERAADGTPRRMVGTHIDITARKLAEERLRNREKLLTAVALATRELISHSDYLAALPRCFKLIGTATGVDHIRLYANRMDNRGDCFTSEIAYWEAGRNGRKTPHADRQDIPFEKIAGLLGPLLKGETCRGLVRDLKGAATRRRLHDQNIRSLVILPIFARGQFWGHVGFDSATERIWTESEYSVFSAFAGALARTIERSLIGSELAAAKQSAEAANELKSQFVANVSHEIRTPMQAILGYAALMKETVADGPNKKYLAAIEKAGASLTGLISDILDLSKIEAGKIVLQTSEVPVRRLLDDIKDLFSWRLQQKNLPLVIDVDPGVPETVLLDELRARQILFNLVGNAIKFTEAGSVRIAARALNFNPAKGSLDLVLTIGDTGIGIPADQQQAIFEPFKQTDGQSNKKYGGTGLGLSITKRLLEIMGGAIAVDSAPGRGAIFTVTLPRVLIGSAARPAPAADAGPLPAHQAPAAPEPASAARSAPPEMLGKLELIRDGLWQECRKTNRVHDIRKLAGLVRIVGDAYHHEETARFAADLQASAAAFDLKHIKILLHHFPALIDRLKAGSGGGNE